MRNERQAPPNPVTPPVERWHPDDSLVEAALVREAKKRPNLLRAIEFIRRETNASIGAAQELLVAVCAAGKVRAWRVNGFQKERIPPQTWRDAMIDKNKLITAVSSGRPRTLQGRIVVISLEDLRHHLGASSGGSPPPTSPLALTVPPPLHVPVTKEPALEVAPVYPMEAPAPTTPPAPEPVVVNNGNQPKKQVELKKYANYQNTHKTETGRWSSRKEDTNWAKKNNCSVEHVRELRRSYKTNLTPEERGQFERHGKRATPK